MLDAIYRGLVHDLKQKPRILGVTLPVARFLHDYGRLRRGLQPRQPPIYLHPAEYRLRWVAALVPDQEEWIERTCASHPHEADEERKMRWSRYWHRFWSRSDRLDAMAELNPFKFDRLKNRFERRYGPILESTNIHMKEE